MIVDETTHVNRTPSDAEARRILHESFGFERFLPFQEQIIATILRGKDVLIVLPTGSGKSLCFQIPALLQEGITIVISPLIALMKDQIDALRCRSLPVASLHSSLSASERKRILDDIRAGLLKMIYISPERLRDGFFLNSLLAGNRTRALWVVDEAHCITEWGHDFRTDYLYIPDALELLSESSQLVMLTATATPIVREDIVRQMRRKSAETICGSFDRPNLYLGCRYARTKNDKLRTLAELLRRPGPGIIYTATRRQCEDVNRFLQEIGKKCEYYHAGRTSEERSHVHERFLSNEIEVIVATNAFGMGVDKPDIRFIIHYAHPGSIDAYYQEIGRGGRDGKRCDCILLFSPFDRRVQEHFIRDSTPAAEQVEECFCRIVQSAGRTGELSLGRSSYEDYNIELFEMEKAGVLSRHTVMAESASIFLSREFRKAVDMCSPVQRDILSALARHLGLAEQGYASAVDLKSFQHEHFPEMSMFALEQTLLHMNDRGIIAFRPTDRNICYEVRAREMSDQMISKIEKSVSARRAFKMRRLETMIRYGSVESCLREYLLTSLGDAHAGSRCRFCDNCI